MLLTAARPSLQSGYARSAGESAYPGLWKGLRHLYAPGVDPNPRILRDLVGGRDFKSVGTTAYSVVRGAVYSPPAADAAGPEFELSTASDFAYNVNKYQFVFSGTKRDASYVRANALFASNGSTTGVIHEVYDTSWGTNFVGLTSQFVGAVSHAPELHTRYLYEASWDGTTKYHSLYGNGRYIGNAQSTTTGSLTTATSAVQIGNAGGSRELEGWEIYLLAWYDRILTRQEKRILARDPLAPFRRRIRWPYSEQPAETPTTGRIFRVGLDLKPSLQSGYARSAGESAYPGLWRGLRHLYAPGVDPNPRILRDLVGGRDFKSVGTTAYSVVRGAVYSPPAADFAGPEFALATASDFPYNGNKYQFVFSGTKRDATYVRANNIFTSDGSAGVRHRITDTYWSSNYTGLTNEFVANVTHSTELHKRYLYEASWDGATKYHSLYGNGNFIGQGQNTTTGTLNAATSQAQIGNVINGASELEGWEIYLLAWYERILTPDEKRILARDPLAPFRRRITIPYSAPPEVVTTGRVFRVGIDLRPALQSGYARSAGESANPDLWDGLIGAWVPMLSRNFQKTWHDYSPYKLHGTVEAGSVTVAQTRHGLLPHFTNDTTGGIDLGTPQRGAYATPYWSTGLSVVSLVFPTDDTDPNGYIIGKDDIFNGWNFTRYYATHAFWYSGTTTLKIATDELSWQTAGNRNKWYTYGMSWDGTTNSSSPASGIFLQGIKRSPSVGVQDGASLHDVSAKPMHIGADKDKFYEFGGRIAAIYLYNRPLKASEHWRFHLDILAPLRRRITVPYTEGAAGPSINRLNFERGWNGLLIPRGVY